MITVLMSRSGSTLGEILLTAPYLEKYFDNILSTKKSKNDLHFSLDKYNVDFLLKQEIEDRLLATEPTIILLLGYLYILPKEICERHEIYNLHPGDIEKWPQLKGKDPLEKFFNSSDLMLDVEHDVELGWELGCVIHKVSPEVDSGEVLKVERYNAHTYQESLDKSHQVAVNMWIDFINTKIN